MSNISGAQVNETIKSSLKLEIPNGNMSYQGMFETASSVEVVLEKVLDITHFRVSHNIWRCFVKITIFRNLQSLSLIAVHYKGVATS